MPQLEVRHYESASGRDVIGQFIDRLSTRDAAKCNAAIEWLRTGDIDYHPNARKHLDGDVWELRVRSAGEQFRFLYGVERGVAYLLVAIHKKQQKVDRDDIRLAQSRFNEVAERGLGQ